MHSFTGKRVLSIQSHVVSGYVGNKCATFPLQLLGFDVDPLNTVQFSNHSGYKLIAGQRLSADDVGELIRGYNGSADSLKLIANIVCELRAKNPSLVYVCDPVMGDAGIIYVSTEVIPIYRNVLLPVADVITPNQFEVELLLDRKLKTTADIRAALDQLHDIGPRYVVISSAELDDTPEGRMYLFGSERVSGSEQVNRFKIGFPKLNGSFTGTGDLFASLLLARLEEITTKHATEPSDTSYSSPSSPLAQACRIVLGSMTRILNHTLSYQQDIPADAPKRGNSAIARACELRLIECRDMIETVSTNYLSIDPFDE
ncbi:Ribokinase-like protein [Syncephalis plumigaleata]|nr:Ribokinase-like protein [Syncephalis plumigaleata]